jgi:uncharacterized protein (DUF1330 family)
MAHSLIGLLQIHDTESFEHYRAAVGTTLTAYSGTVKSRYSVDGFCWDELRCGDFQAVVILEFPDKASAQAWAAGPEYAQLLDVRRQAMSLTLFGAEPA